MSSALAAEGTRVGRVRFSIVAMLFAVTIVNYADRATLAIAGPVLSKDLGLSAVEMGVNFFDTADTYGLGRSEETLGETLHALLDAELRDSDCTALLNARGLRESGVAVDRIVGRAAFEAELRRRGFSAVENAGQIVIFCNREPLRRIT